jgi:hypothetical protein
MKNYLVKHFIYKFLHFITILQIKNLQVKLKLFIYNFNMNVNSILKKNPIYKFHQR